MDEVVLRFPMIADKIFKELDNVALANCKHVSRQWCDFISEQRTELMRKIQKYIDQKNKHYEDWKKVLKKAPISILKEVFSAIEKRQSLRDRELWKFTSDNKLLNKSGLWKYSDTTWTNFLTNNLNQMNRTPEFLQDVQTHHSGAGTGGAGGPLAPPIFGISVNPIQTGGGQIMATITTGPPKVFHLPAPLVIVM